MPQRRSSALFLHPSCSLLTNPLPQIDWNKVAHDPILSQEITNGHAARMRYSRFKKQMEGTTAVRRPRNIAPASPTKKRVEKNSKSPRKVKERNPSDAAERVKSEASESGYGTAEGTPEAGPEGANVKREHISGGEESLYSTGTPVNSESPTPSPGFAASQDMNDMMSSFGMPGPDHLSHEHLSSAHIYPGILEDPTQAYGMGMQMSMGLVDPFENMWHQPQSQADGEESVLVKTEERWEETYRQG
jgi:hypothetical protein